MQFFILNRFPPHETRLRNHWSNAFAHSRSPQRADLLQQEKTEPAQALHRQEVREQAAIEKIDGERAARYVGTPHLLVPIGDVLKPDVHSAPTRVRNEFADRGRIA